MNGQVTVNESPGKSRLYRFCEKQIDHWLSNHALAPGATPSEFRVAFTEDDANRISCVTEIQMGDLVLRGCDMDADTQAAFLHSLKRLHAAVPEHAEL